MLDTLAAVKQAYDNKPKKDDDEDQSARKKPAASTENRKGATPSSAKIVNKARRTVKSKTEQTESKGYSRDWKTVPNICEHASRKSFCCRGPSGGKMFSCKTKPRKRAQDEAVGWIKVECKKLGVPAPRAKCML